MWEGPEWEVEALAVPLLEEEGWGEPLTEGKGLEAQASARSPYTTVRHNDPHILTGSHCTIHHPQTDRFCIDSSYNIHHSGVEKLEAPGSEAPGSGVKGSEAPGSEVKRSEVVELVAKAREALGWEVKESEVVELVVEASGWEAPWWEVEESGAKESEAQRSGAKAWEAPALEEKKRLRTS